ncbi:MAG: protein kinase [Pirellulaceae bacterium]|nr:protein kinase [Pirellulaceae bacterium]
MTDNPRVQQLIDELLESHGTPEEVCASCPELLPLVRRRWSEIRRIQEELDALFPPSRDGDTTPLLRPPAACALPEIPNYRVESVLGHGGVGVVYRAYHLRLHRPVALKMLLARAHALPKDCERFEREAEAVAALRHPNIVQIYEVGDVGGQPYFTMELVEGGNLAEKIQGVPQPARQAAALVAALAEAVHLAHERGIVHRDLKPGNILLAADGTPKVTDFGLARRMDDTEGLTITGAIVGTPSYMAPEQARTDKNAVGPATDIYALGAILYELLTGRPPFRAESATATLQQVLADEPVSPTRLNRRVPRDMETICLKCLQKEPHKRYASAQALAEDLHRFGRGEPIHARPVGVLERVARKVRRRPALAGTLAVGVLLAAALLLTIVWWQVQQATLTATAVAYAEADLGESARLRDSGEFKASVAVLERAKERLNGYVPPALRDRLHKEFENLELAMRLDGIRLDRALIRLPIDLLGVLGSTATSASAADDPHSESSACRSYEEAFRDAGLGAPGDDPAETAARVRASPLRAALVAALDDWAACASRGELQDWALAVARHADPDSWRDRVRDPATCDNPEALRDLAEAAPVAQQTPHLLALLGARLQTKNLDAAPFLRRVVEAYPADFWVNIEMGNSLHRRSNVLEAIGYYRAAMALRPELPAVHYAIGNMYLDLKRWDDAIAAYEQAVRLDPDNVWYHNRLGFTMAWKGGRDDDAIAQFRQSIRLDPHHGWSHYLLAVALENKGQLIAAADEFQAVARLLPEKRVEANRRHRGLLLKLGRGTEVCADWKEELAARPPDHDEWFGYAELCLYLGEEAEYRLARRELLTQFGNTTDPTVAERAGRACLLLPASGDELRQAVALADRCVAAGRSGHEGAYPYCLFAQGLARYREGRFQDAIELMQGEAASVMGPCPRLILAMAQHQSSQPDEAGQNLAAAIASCAWSPDEATNHDVWIGHILRREAEAMIAVGPAVGEQGK